MTRRHLLALATGGAAALLARSRLLRRLVPRPVRHIPERSAVRAPTHGYVERPTS